jgi:hypothetical protein
MAYIKIPRQPKTHPAPPLPAQHTPSHSREAVVRGAHSRRNIRNAILGKRRDLTQPLPGNNFISTLFT